MIEVTGPEGTPEYEVASHLAGAFARLWPGIDKNSPDEDYIRITAGAKLSGYKVSDIDVVIAARFNSNRYITRTGVFTARGGRRVTGERIKVASFVAAVEVKDHDSAGMRATAGNVSVRYDNGWKDATQQNDDQRFALLAYLRDRTREEPWTYRCLVLRGIDALPRNRGRVLPASGAVAGTFDATDFLMAIATVTEIQERAGGYIISSGNGALMEQVLQSPLFDAIVPSRLDRLRMDRIAARPKFAKELAGFLGESRVHLRGKGGTGKTVLLLQAAHEAFEQHGKRTLVLTYNHALAADIQRLLAMMRIPAAGESGGVEVRTVMSFCYSWFRAIGLVGADDEAGFETYENLCQEALEMIEGGAITGEDLVNARRKATGQFDHDALIIDEAQDWPAAESAFVCALYGGESVSLADGVDQLVRGDETDWKATTGGQRAKNFHSLDECLRMKASLGRFANAVAARAGLNWQVQPNGAAAGGRVIIAAGEYATMTGLRNELIESAHESGNAGVDFLHCVPPAGLVFVGNQKASRLARSFQSDGFEAWDGVDPIVRRDYPRSADAFRVVQYESCRGLEGWVTVLEGLDEFWDRKRDDALTNLRAHSNGDAADPVLLAEAIAWRWVMIALTRPIDTLVISIWNMDSVVGRLMKSVQIELPDIIEVR